MLFFFSFSRLLYVTFGSALFLTVLRHLYFFLPSSFSPFCVIFLFKRTHGYFFLSLLSLSLSVFRSLSLSFSFFSLSCSFLFLLFLFLRHSLSLFLFFFLPVTVSLSACIFRLSGRVAGPRLFLPFLLNHWSSSSKPNHYVLSPAASFPLTGPAVRHPVLSFPETPNFCCSTPPAAS